MSGGVNQAESYAIEIIGLPPNRLTRYGISFIFLFVLLILFFAYKIDYSDAITSEVIINSQIPTVNVTAEHAGIVEQILANNGTQISAGDDVVLMRNNTDLTTVKELKAFLLNGDLSTESISEFSLKALGSLRADFLVLVGFIDNYQQAQRTDILQLKRQQLAIDNMALKNQVRELKNQNDLYVKKNTLYEKKYLRAKELMKKKLLSESELDQAKSNYIDTQIAVNKTRVEVRKIRSTINNNEQQIDLLTINNDELKTELLLKIESQKHLLIENIKNWEKKYLIKAPISGRLSLPSYILTYQGVGKKQELFSITPESSKLIGRVKIPEFGSGRITKNQNVVVQLDSYPHQEFGEIHGKVLNKSISVHDSAIYIDIKVEKFNSFTNQLTTSFNKQIDYLPNMQGQVKIIINIKNILSRIFENLIIKL